MAPCLDVASTDPCRRRPRVPLPCLLAAVAVLVAAAIPPTHAVCPAVDSRCFCRRKFSYFNYLYCEKLGNISKVPAFRESTTLYDTLQIRFETVLMTLQAHAFRGVRAERVLLQVRQIINNILLFRQAQQTRSSICQIWQNASSVLFNITCLADCTPGFLTNTFACAFLYVEAIECAFKFSREMYNTFLFVFGCML